MKLIACHIENFGKLSNVTLQFSDGLNVINEANAWGKSTLAAFLKVMFYGLDAKKTSGAFEKERVMYRPWQGGVFGGEVDFEVRGKAYRISRSFGRTEKADEYHLYDLKTNLECFDFSEDLGNELFELDSASFKRSIYIAQNDCASGSSDSINAKLGNLAENTNDINNFESANRQLKEMLNQLTPDRVTGSIKKRKNYITQLTQELRGFEAAQEGLEGIRYKDQEVTQQIQELLSIRQNYADALIVASEDSRRKELYAQYESICRELVEKEKKRDFYEQFFPIGIPAEIEFQMQMQNVNKMNELQIAARSYELTMDEAKELQKLEEMFDTKVPTEDDIDAALQMHAKVDKQKEEIAHMESKLSVYNMYLNQVAVAPKFSGAVAYKIFLAIGIVFALIAIGAFAVWHFDAMPMFEEQFLLNTAMIGCGGCAIFCLIGFILGIRVYTEKMNWTAMVEEENANTEEKVEDLVDFIAAAKEDVRRCNASIGKFLSYFHVYCEVEEYQSKLYELKNQARTYLQLKDKSQKHESEKAAYKEVRNEFLSFIRTYRFEVEEDSLQSLTQLQTKATEYQLAETAYKEVCAKRDAFEQKQDKDFWTRQTLCPYTLEELNTLIAQTDSKLEECKVAKAQYSKQLEDLQEQLDLRDEKEAELKDLHVSQKKDMQKYNLLMMTQEYLQLAKEQFTARYMAPIAKGFGKYFAMLTGDHSESWMIDANLNLKLREQGELRETHWLSAGFQDLIGVCMRLALVDAMYKEEKPFLILDDPFVNLDREKVTAGNELLLEVSEEYQVIYFTCHESRCP